MNIHNDGNNSVYKLNIPFVAKNRLELHKQTNTHYEHNMLKLDEFVECIHN